MRTHLSHKHIPKCVLILTQTQSLLYTNPHIQIHTLIYTNTHNTQTFTYIHKQPLTCFSDTRVSKDNNATDIVLGVVAIVRPRVATSVHWRHPVAVVLELTFKRKLQLSLSEQHGRHSLTSSLDFLDSIIRPTFNTFGIFKIYDHKSN